MSLRVLCVVPRTLYPALSGGEIRVTSLMRALRGRASFTALTFWQSGAELDQAAGALEFERRDGVQTVFVRRTPGWRPAAGDAPDIADSFHDPLMEQAVRSLSAEHDLVQLEFTQTLQYAAHVAPGVPVIGVEHDTSALSSRRSYLRLDPERARREQALSLAYLRRCLPACARVVVMSEADKLRLGRWVPQARAEVVPTGVDLQRFPFAPLEGRQAGEACFVGHYPHFPNEEAALTLCREVLPRLRELVPSARVRLVGSNPTPAVRALAGPAVEVVGTVAEVAPELRRARVFIAPMRLGYGIKGKILEAFACGTPVVATARSFEAMPGIEHERHALMAATPAALARLAARVLQDAELSSRLAREARAYVEARFGWERQADLMHAVYLSVLTPPRVPDIL